MSQVYQSLLVRGSVDARLKFEDGHESEPCYIENFVGVETADEVVTLAH